MSESDDHDGGSGGRERRAGGPEEPYENVFGVRPGANGAHWGQVLTLDKICAHVVKGRFC